MRGGRAAQAREVVEDVREDADLVRAARAAAGEDDRDRALRGVPSCDERSCGGRVSEARSCAVEASRRAPDRRLRGDRESSR